MSNAVHSPLDHEPRRIRPPFDVASYAPDERVAEETVEAWRARVHADRVAALLEPLDGVELGAYDRRIVHWLADWDVSTVGTIASLFYRAREAGGAR
jgi:hypothetical protein